MLRKTGKHAPRLPPNLPDYAAWRRSFSWERAWRELGATPGGRLNMASLALGRHAIGANAGRTALSILDRELRATRISYAALAAQVNQFADALDGLAVEPNASPARRPTTPDWPPR